MLKRLLDWNPTRLPDGADALARHAALASIVLGVASGVQGMLAAELAFGRVFGDDARESLTALGRDFYWPERELRLYVAGCAATLGLVWLLLRAVGWLLDREPDRRIVAGWALTEWLTAAATSVLFAASALGAGRSLASDPSRLVRAMGLLLLMGPGAVGYVVVAIAMATGRGRAPLPSPLVDRFLDLVRIDGADLATHRRSEPQASPVPVPGRAASLLLDLAAVATIVAVVYTPAWDRAAEMAAHERGGKAPYFHINAFVMGPAVGFRDGRALATDLFSQYGVAWPMLVASLDPIFRLGYTNFIGLSMIYGCFYFAGIYALLRLTLGSTPWALSGTLVAIGMQLFRGIQPENWIWVWPSSTFMRGPLDVWFFLALLLHLRTDRVAWLLLASALGGLAVAFEIDTGIYLTAALLIYAILRAASPRPEAARMGGAATIVAAASSYLAALLSCLWMAGRGTIFRPAFWRGFVEGVVDFSGGLYALPMATEPDAVVLVYFYASVSVLLVLCARAFVPAPDECRRRSDVFWAVWSAYGLAFLILFVYRSHTYNFYKATVPIVAATTYVIATATRWAEGRFSGDAARPAWRSLSSLSSYAMVGLSLAFLVRSPIFRSYPSLGRSVVAAAVGRGWDSGGGPDSPRREFPDAFRDVAAEMTARHARGRSVGVIHPSDTMFYLHTGCPFPFRYHSMMVSAYTTDLLRRYLDDIARARPDDIFLVRPEVDDSFMIDMWRAVHAWLAREYTFDRAIGSFDLWRRVTGPSATAGTDLRGAGEER